MLVSEEMVAQVREGRKLSLPVVTRDGRRWVMWKSRSGDLHLTPEPERVTINLPVATEEGAAP